MMNLKESDWKLFRSLHAVALERFCERFLKEVAEIASSKGATNHHQRYREIYEIITTRDKDLARVFDGMSRSNAWIQLRMMRELQLLTNEEVARFSPEIRQGIEGKLI